MKQKRVNRAGRIVMNGVVLEPHEYDTILFLTGLGKDIELIQQSHTPAAKSPDLYMDKLVWEAKSPVINERRALERLFYRASMQSSNLVFDLRRLKGEDTAAIQVIERCFKTTRRVRNLYLITKDNNLRKNKKR